MSRAVVLEPTLGGDATRAAASERTGGSGAVRVRLDFLDGLRGLAAFYVVIHHAAQLYMTEKADPPSKWFGLYRNASLRQDRQDRQVKSNWILNRWNIRKL